MSSQCVSFRALEVLSASSEKESIKRRAGDKRGVGDLEIALGDRAERSSPPLFYGHPSPL